MANLKDTFKNIFHREKAEEDEDDIFFNSSEEAEEESDWELDDSEEGQLAVDVYHTPSEVIIRAPIAGVHPNEIDVTIKDDVVVIKGNRFSRDDFGIVDHLYKECHWGRFSRTIILPITVRSQKADALFRNGILTIRAPKSEDDQSPLVIAVEDDY
ncbi:MAG: Hsp20/alpha crystallin family protein [Candidatus Jacksonbacteria bacterium]|jgi:HSP20 family protein|nr:Hsp20/alpha crystallin family protein [Candidatus Jacksonbacteria bacterium]MBT6034818.1 Hsp20/alpha crystallin family protein [Candidatus Jacksonbacteria bacterium]MBT6301240.1 Hsp20/alpha crystallin family protein [Candidatus Jacksonbacteria bacterium]MBT6757163.1 Hsp20/alpha crystallin family protein [Candidatus Jacksonbacteria bacterium]MBT6955345.1 Hsp20/alpha crystallin family protein [Candidatus Jacksonbacteria bacterium]